MDLALSAQRALANDEPHLIHSSELQSRAIRIRTSPSRLSSPSRNRKPNREPSDQKNKGRIIAAPAFTTF